MANIKYLECAVFQQTDVTPTEDLEEEINEFFRSYGEVNIISVNISIEKINGKSFQNIWIFYGEPS